MPRAGEIRVWGLANYRNRAILEPLASDPRFSVRFFECAAENRYLPDAGSRAAAAHSAARDALRRARPRIEALTRDLFPDIPRAHEVALHILDRSMRLVVPAASVETSGWKRLLERDRPDLILSGIPWGGDIRSLSLVALRERIPAVACQDGVLAEVGAGGVPVGSGALAWGPLGRAWFVRRGFPEDSVFEVGDPYLEKLVEEVGREERVGLCQRLRIPAAERVLLASVQNSAPHFLPFDPADPVRVVRVLLEAFSSVRGFCLVLKPHPRLPLVDGGRRMALLRRMAAEVPAARIVEPDEPIRGLMALADAHVGEGDTLSLEMVACGKPVILLEHPGLPPFYPDFSTSGAMMAVRSAQDLAERLRVGLDPPAPGARRALLDRHLCKAIPPEEALLAVAGRVASTRRTESR